MINRRHFLQTTTLASVAALIKPVSAIAQTAGPVGVQLYTVRDLMASDTEGTIKAIGKLGYSYLESFQSDKGEYFGYIPKDFRKMCADNNLDIVSTHISDGQKEIRDKKTVFNNLSSNFGKTLEDANVAGIKFIVCPYISPEDRKTEDGIKRMCDLLNVSGKKAKDAGLTLCYHNHDFEFTAIGTSLIYDMILQHTDPELVKMELDLYWTSRMQIDATKLFRKSKGRYPLWHVKDKDAKTRATTEVGSGDINFGKTFKAKETAGLQYYFVEQDTCAGSPLVSLQKSINYIKNDFNF